MANLLYDLIFDYTLRNVAIGSAVIGIVSGALGSFAVLRRQSLLGDTISHAALPGIALAFLLTRTKAPFVLLLGAAIAGWIGTLFILSITTNTRIKEDSAQGIVLSVFFGIGLVLLTFIQRMPTAAKAGLDKFIFGQAATLMTEDIITMSILGCISLAIMVIYWKELKVLSFDREFAGALGLPVRKLDILLTTLIVVAIVIGLQTVGVILMSAMIVTPGASARQWTDRLRSMVVISSLFGALAGVAGALISSTVNHIPTGPMIVIILALISAFSIIFGAKRGLFWSFLRRMENRRIFAAEKILAELFYLSEPHKNYLRGHEFSIINALHSRDEQDGLRNGLRYLAEQDLVYCDSGARWGLTETGLKRVMERLNIKDHPEYLKEGETR